MTTDTSSNPQSVSIAIADSRSAPIDQEKFISRSMGNVAFAMALLDEIECHGKQHVDEIAFHASAGQTHMAAEAAHCLKGAAAILGADLIQELAARIEEAGRANDLSVLDKTAGELRIEMNRCLKNIPTLRIEAQKRLSSPHQSER